MGATVGDNLTIAGAGDGKLIKAGAGFDSLIVEAGELFCCCCLTPADWDLGDS